MDSKTKLYYNLKDCLENNNLSTDSHDVLYPKDHKTKTLSLDKCYKCVKKKRFEILDKCDCGISYCLKHRFHECPLKKEKLQLPNAVNFQKINKI